MVSLNTLKKGKTIMTQTTPHLAVGPALDELLVRPLEMQCHIQQFDREWVDVT